ncbi:MAG: hypothetical protein QM572_07570, partial [Nocardioides sp.]
MVTITAAAGRSATDVVLTGTPVVPGLAYGPVLMVAQDLDLAALASYGDGGHATPADALAAFDAAADRVADGYVAKAA